MVEFFRLWRHDRKRPQNPRATAKTAATPRHQSKGCHSANSIAQAKNEALIQGFGILLATWPPFGCAKEEADYQPAQLARVSPMPVNVPARAQPTTAPPGANTVTMPKPTPAAQVQVMLPALAPMFKCATCLPPM